MAKVRVPQVSDEIVLSHAGDPGIHYPVRNHVVDVPDADLSVFLENVPGATLASDVPSVPDRPVAQPAAPALEK